MTESETPRQATGNLQPGAAPDADMSAQRAGPGETLDESGAPMPDRSALNKPVAAKPPDAEKPVVDQKSTTDTSTGVADPSRAGGSVTTSSNRRPDDDETPVTPPRPAPPPAAG